MRHGFWTSLSRIAITTTAAVFFVGGNSVLMASPIQITEDGKAKKTTEPVYRVSKLEENDTNKTRVASATNVEGNRVADSSAMLPSSPANPETTVEPTTRAPHPLDRAVTMAEEALKKMRAEVYDYTAIMAKREQINGVVGSTNFMNVKVRCPRTANNGQATPFSIYMKFLKPKDAAGREVIWIEGENDGKLIAHEGSGLIAMRRFYLDPTGFIAMKGQRYPITDAGLENMVVKLIEKAERDRDAGPCEVNYREGAKINKRPCTMIELIHHDPNAGYEFHKAQVFLDNELNLPVRYVAYDFPEAEGEKPKLIEEYTYYNVKVNVGLTDEDFSPENKKYKFPKR